MLPSTSSPSLTSFAAERRFFDDANFPKGFRRCGDFTQKEAELLEAHGVTLKQLAEGRLAPRTAEEQRFVDVVKGLQSPSSIMEKLWVKYATLAQGRPFYAVVGTNLVRPSEPDAYLETIDDEAGDDDAPEPEETP